MISLYKHHCDVLSYEEITNEWGQIEQVWTEKYIGLECTFGKKSFLKQTDSDYTKSLTKYILHVDEKVMIPIGSKITFKETNQTFKAQFSMPYKLLKKQEIELVEWQ